MPRWKIPFHILRDCPLSKIHWRSLKFDSIDFTTWLQTGVQGNNSPLFVVGVWWNWKARNSICIAHKYFPLYKLKMEVCNLASMILAIKTCMASNSMTTRWVSWHPTREDCVILNVDGSNIDNLDTSCMGSLLRNSNGDWIWGFSGHLSRHDHLFVELMALHKGLSLGWIK